MKLGEKECPLFMRKGSCGYGSRCVYHYPAPTLMVVKEFSNSMKEEHHSQIEHPGPCTSLKMWVPIWKIAHLLNLCPPLLSGWVTSQNGIGLFNFTRQWFCDQMSLCKLTNSRNDQVSLNVITS